MKNLFIIYIINFLLVHASAPALAGMTEGLKAMELRNYTLALKEFTPLAQKNNSEAQYYLGEIYSKANIACSNSKIKSSTLPANDQKSEYWYQKSAKNNNPKALTELGKIYANNKKDYYQSFKYLERAAMQNYAPAQAKLGILYEWGYGVEKDINKAISLYTKASENGESNGQYYLALSFHNGKNGSPDFKRSLELYKLAAEQGHPKALFNLGTMYQNGEGVKKDITEATNLYLKAATLGDSLSIFNLATIYANKPKNRKNSIIAYALFSNVTYDYRSSDREAYDQAATYMLELSKSMNQLDIDEAKKLSSQMTQCVDTDLIKRKQVTNLSEAILNFNL
jgi:TPR repeat protein